MQKYYQKKNEISLSFALHRNKKKNSGQMENTHTGTMMWKMWDEQNVFFCSFSQADKTRNLKKQKRKKRNGSRGTYVEIY